MSSMGFYMRFTVAVLSGFVFHVACHDSRRRCFEVESKDICYFIPNVSAVDWDTAWKTCRDLDATLPVILNENGQTALNKYLSKHFSIKPVWTAGRYNGSKTEWRWLNDKEFIGIDKPTCPTNAQYCYHETQTVLTKDLRYEARYPTRDYAFICNFPDINCRNESQKSTQLQWKGGCLSWISNNRLPLNKARNECLKGGGDLATFSEAGDLEDLQELSSAIKTDYANEYWIGLHRKWWIWNSTGLSCNSENVINLTKGCVIPSDDDKTWFNARNHCLKNGSDLAILTDADLITLNISKRLTSRYSYWIGLRQNAWHWIWQGTAKSGEEITNSNWPTHSSSQENECITIDASNGGWQAVSCTDRNKVVCEISASESATQNDSDSNVDFNVILYSGVGAGVVIIVICSIVIILAVHYKNKYSRNSHVASNSETTVTADAYYQDLNATRKQANPNRNPGGDYAELQLHPIYAEVF